MPSQKPLANRDFVKRMQDYLPMDATVWNTDPHGTPGTKLTPAVLADDTFYGFDANMMLAASHAIEDLALDEANGQLVATFQDFKNFESQRERYWQLAATIDSVQVAVCGGKPRRGGRVQFVNMDRTALTQYWIVLFQSRRSQALLMGRQLNDVTAIDDKQFLAYYSFDRGLLHRVRQEIADLLARRCGQFGEFRRLHVIDRAAKQIQAAFAEEHAALVTALQKWQRGGDSSPSLTFVAEIDKALQRLQQLKEALAGLLGESDASPHHD